MRRRRARQIAMAVLSAATIAVAGCRGVSLMPGQGAHDSGMTWGADTGTDSGADTAPDLSADSGIEADGGRPGVWTPTTIASASAPFATGSLSGMSTCMGASPWALSQQATGTIGPLSPPLISFEGAHATASCGSAGIPSDVSGAIGPIHYLQAINHAITVYDRAGELLAGPVMTATLFTPMGFADCSSDATGTTVAYDRYADRWIISHPDQTNGICVAVSQTSDPTGSYNLYAFPVDAGRFPAQAKLAVWSDGYYLTANAESIDAGIGNFISVFERGQILQGLPARSITFLVPDPTPPPPQRARSAMLAAFVDGPNLPPLGTPNFIVQVQDNDFGFPADRLQVYELAANWSDPGASTLTAKVSLTPTGGCDDAGVECFHTGVCLGQPGTCLPQPGTDSALFDPHAAGEMMYRLTYRGFPGALAGAAGYEAMVFNHTIAATDDPPNVHAAIRWYELRRSAGSDWSIFQQGTHAPDVHNRWLGSMAMDRRGNIALGYAVAGEDLYPSIRYSGRLATDPPGTLAPGERSLVEGQGALLAPAGDAGFGGSAEMTVDPVDDCTFWLTNTFVPVSSSYGDWHTEVGAFRFWSCTPPPPSIGAGTPVGYARSPGLNSINYVDTTGHLKELFQYGLYYWELGDLSNLTGVTVSVGAISNYLRNDGSSDVVACASDSNAAAHVWEFVNPSYWQAYDLTANTGAPEGGCAALAAYVRSDLTDAVVFTAGDGHVHELSLFANWIDTDLTLAASGPDGAGDPAGYVRSDGVNSVVYRGPDRRLHELWQQPGSTSWTDADISGGIAVNAASDPRPCVSSHGINTVVFRGADDNVYADVLSVPSTSNPAPGWSVMNLTILSGAPTAAGDPSCYARSDGVNAVVFVGTDGHIREIEVNDLTGGATHSDLTPAGASVSGSVSVYVRSDGINAVVYSASPSLHVHQLSLVGGQPPWVDDDLTAMVGAF
jgi:hypothetical protein